MNNMMRQTPSRTVKKRTIRARLLSNLRTYGSRMRDQFRKVYSLSPARARTGSIPYCWDEIEYTPMVNGRISCNLVSLTGGSPRKGSDLPNSEYASACPTEYRQNQPRIRRTYRADRCKASRTSLAVPDCRVPWRVGSLEMRRAP